MIDVRMPYWKVDSVGFNKLLDFGKHLTTTPLAEGLLHMLYLRVSQINGCGYCVDVHYKDALKAGVPERKVNAVVAWHHTPFFTPQEQAALKWAEVLTQIEKERDVPMVYFEAMKAQFSEEEISAATFAIIHMNALNRMALAFGRKADA